MRLHRTPAPRAHRFLAWQVLHATLMCGLRRVAQLARRGLARWADVEEHAFCRVPGCADARVHESIQHVFLDCPVARQVTMWVCDLWAAVTGGQPPPRSVAVFLLGDRRQWDPGGVGLCELWGIVRLATLYCLWEARCVARLRGRPTTARAVVAAIVTHLRGRIRDDSLRALPDSPDTAAPFGARPRVSVGGFVARWCHRGVLCTMSSSGAPVVRLALVHPVPPPLLP